MIGQKPNNRIRNRLPERFVLSNRPLEPFVVRWMLFLLERVGELVYFSFGLFTCATVALLNFADELISLSFGDVEVVVCELSPFFFGFSFCLFPVSFYLVPIHVCKCVRFFAQTVVV